MSRNAGLEESADETRGCRRPVLAAGGECRLPPLGLSVWVVRRLTLAGSTDCLLVDLFGPAGGGPGGQVTSSESREAIGGVRVGWVHGERAGHHTDALGRECIPSISINQQPMFIGAQIMYPHRPVSTSSFMPCGGPVGASLPPSPPSLSGHSCSS